MQIAFIGYINNSLLKEILKFTFKPNDISENKYILEIELCPLKSQDAFDQFEEIQI
jgi:hypothetical protein